ncbi:TlpA disulfide reductase family protein [Rhodoferax sp.]|uniref:peroxiredoxin family protein n=1 Tax=Rhodoferax sp. TaxID=50421 RepID=UPI00284D724F|nr:TlpA disulfide reductase family protein [Rhodoferax sp.]MDR3368134.1 TlpA disulfide reductase family protein [Rhodoferax sp.]
MKCFALVACIIFGSNAMGADLSVGSPAPDIQAKLLDSTTVFQLSQQHGKTVIVNFWATWCAPCKAEMPTLQAYFDKHKSDGLEILSISMDDPRDLPEVRKIAQQYSFQVAIKPDANIKALGRIWRMPTTFVIDREGILRKNGQVGDAAITMTELESLVTPLLSKAQ